MAAPPACLQPQIEATTRKGRLLRKE